MPRPKLETHGKKFRLKVRVPKDLVQHFPGKSLLVQNFDPPLASAEIAAMAWETAVRAKFLELRSPPSPLQSIPVPVRYGLPLADLGQVLAEEVRRYKTERLAADEMAPKLAGALRGLIHHKDSLLSGLPLEGVAADRSLAGRLASLDIDEDSAHEAAEAQTVELLAPFVEKARLRLRAVGVELDGEAALSAGVSFAFADLEIAQTIRQRASGQLTAAPNPEPRKHLEGLAPTAPAAQPSSPRLAEVVKAFLAEQDQAAPMFKKYQAVIPMLLEVIGDRPIADIKQQDINEYFQLLLNLPPRWADKRQQMKKGVRELAAMSWEKCISPKTFDCTYIAAARPFLKYAIRVYGDQGFPRHLTTEGIKYRGDRVAGEAHQRAMRPAELKQLFEGRKVQEFAQDPTQAGRYWLPLLGLYTGARVNEVCQLNPQWDVRQDQETGIWFFDITDETPTAEGVTKSVKNKTSKRKIPIHSALLGLGFLDYLERVKATGAALLFPEFPPGVVKAASKAEKWFRKHLDALGLRDETPGARIVGFHAFRSTLSAKAEEIDEPRVDAITGHKRDGESTVQRGYRGETPLPVKQQILERFTFPINPPKPSH